MGAYIDRTAGQAVQQQSCGSDGKPSTALTVGLKADVTTPSLTTHAIEPITMRVPDACRYIGISHSTLYLLIADGEIETIKLGCSTLVLTESLKALIARRRGQSEICGARNGD